MSDVANYGLSPAEVDEVRSVTAVMTRFVTQFRKGQPDFETMIEVLDSLAGDFPEPASQSFRSAASALRELMGTLDDVAGRFETLMVDN